MFSARCNCLSFSIWKSDQTAAFHNIISIFNLCYISPLLPHVSSTICCREIEVSKDMSLKKRWYFATQICGQAAAPAVRLPLLPKNWPHTPCDSVGQLRTTHAAASVTSLERGGVGRGSHCWWEHWRLLNRPDWPLQFNLSVSREALMWMQVHMFTVGTRHTSWAKATCAQCAGRHQWPLRCRRLPRREAASEVALGQHARDAPGLRKLRRDINWF